MEFLIDCTTYTTMLFVHICTDPILHYSTGRWFNSLVCCYLYKSFVMVEATHDKDSVRTEVI